MIYSNFHTHTRYCDGADTAEAMVLEAIRLGSPEIGFSGHSYTAFDTECCMSPEITDIYRAEIARLKQEYRDRISVRCGIEQDIFSGAPDGAFDYVIGAVHHVTKDGVYYPIDASKKSQTDSASLAFGGDFYAFAESYYREVARLYEVTHCDIIAHFDLIGKYNENYVLFDETDARYRNAVIRALDAVAETPAVVEINTGAMSRGCKSTPYPDAFILKELKRRDMPVIISSDAHSKSNLLYGFPESERLANDFGLRIIRSVVDFGK